MPRNAYFVAIAFFATVNGLFNSAVLSFVFFHVLLLAPAILFGSAPLTFMFASLITATVTIIVAGIPAALYERLRGLDQSDDVSLWIWLAGTALLTLPAMGRFLTIGL
ncbi:hypothetical protein [Blastochloris viridis]|uniref:Uncharacterized protein n=1 Tax=Blastochloris viridis TaxID=1079 RepID=A0A0H5BAS5_BLAVI|nr:hypothetical protein [Blastochloris viridis]ALK10685.1 hypothetical protein BVIR_2922 [Blastochloris viridis]BAR99352.1 hypothetical protein BV133_1759 [Blastochloris viridis]CUU43348.1 hypothetical protein BVIRIDIS_23670 [Blastochloris viridis]